MLDLNNRTTKTKNSGISGHFANEPQPTLSESDYLQFKLSKFVNQEFVDTFFRKYFSRENIDSITPNQLIDSIITGSRQTGKPLVFGLMIEAFIDMLKTYTHPDIKESLLVPYIEVSIFAKKQISNNLSLIRSNLSVRNNDSK